MQAFLHLFVFIAFLMQIQTAVYGLEEAKEMGCVPPPLRNVDVDFKWMDSVDTFYITMWSQLYAQRTASDAFETDVSNLEPGQLGTASCLMFKKGNIVKGFGKTINYNITRDETALSFIAPWSNAKSGRFTFHMTDNKSFILGITCWGDNQSTWSIISTTPTLDPATRSTVLAYVTSLGFRADLGRDERFETCPDVKWTQRLHNTILPTYVLIHPGNYLTRGSPYYTQTYFNQLPLGYWRK